MHGTQVETARENLGHLLAVVGDATTRPAERKTGTNHCRKTDLCCELEPSAHRVHKLRLRHIKTDLVHRILEQETVFSLLDSLELGPDQLDAVLLQKPRVCEI